MLFIGDVKWNGGHGLESVVGVLLAAGCFVDLLFYLGEGELFYRDLLLRLVVGVLQNYLAELAFA